LRFGLQFEGTQDPGMTAVAEENPDDDVEAAPEAAPGSVVSIDAFRKK